MLLDHVDGIAQNQNIFKYSLPTQDWFGNILDLQHYYNGQEVALQASTCKY